MTLIQISGPTSPFVVVDGGLSTALQGLGHTVDGELWTARLLRDQPVAIVDAHRAFIDAGAQVLITSSYQASVQGFVSAGSTIAEAHQMLASTTALARQAIALAATPTPGAAATPTPAAAATPTPGAVVVAASVGPYGACLADGSEYHGRYQATWAQVRKFHADRLDVLIATGPDLLAIETIPTQAEAEIIVELVAESGIPAWLTFSCSDESTTCGGDPIEQAVRSIDGRLHAVGVNCTDPRHVDGLLRRITSITDLALVAYPNHGGSWDADGKAWSHDHRQAQTCEIDPQFVAGWVDAGARYIGGCCGIGVTGIQELCALRDGWSS